MDHSRRGLAVCSGTEYIMPLGMRAPLLFYVRAHRVNLDVLPARVLNHPLD